MDAEPPNSPEAEKGVLGCVLTEPGESMNECEECGVQAVWFHDLRHALIYKTMQELHRLGHEIDLITLQEKMRQDGNLEHVGGLGYLSTLPDAVPSAANLPYYLDIVRQKWLARRLIHSCLSGLTAMQDSKDFAQTLDEVSRDILKISEERVEDRERGVKEVIHAVVNDLEDYHRGRAQMRGIATGLEYVDKLLCGLGGKNGNYDVISARPGMGKTAMAMQIATYAAIDYEYWEPVMQDGRAVVETVDGQEKIKCERKKGVPVAVFSLEMTSEALVQRMLFQRAKADLQRWRNGFAVAGDFPPLTKAAAEIANAKLWIDDEGRCTVESLKAKARRLHRQHGIRLFIIDYIQLMRSSAKRFREDRVQELAEISGEIQSLGKELNVPFIVLAQMNRDYEKEPNRAPRLSDLKDCGSIEQDADLVGFLYGPKLKDAAEQKYDEAMTAVYGDDWSQYPQRVNLLIAKNRHGPTGVCELLFQRSCTHFMDYNVWLKQHGHKQAALGESQYKKSGPLPSNEEMGL